MICQRHVKSPHGRMTSPPLYLLWLYFPLALLNGRMASPPPSVFSYDTADDEGEKLASAREVEAAAEVGTAFDSALTSVLVLLGLVILACVLYQSRVSIESSIRAKWRPGRASDAEMDAFDEGAWPSTRIRRTRQLGDGDDTGL